MLSTGGLIDRLFGRGVNGACRHRRGTSRLRVSEKHERPARKTSPNDPWGPVSPSRLCSGGLSAEPASASFGGILAGVPSPAGGRNDSLAPRSCSSSRSCLAFRAAAPARPAATFFGSLTFSVTLSTGLCVGSSAVSWFSYFISAIVYSNRAAVFKTAMLQGGQRGS